MSRPGPARCINLCYKPREIMNSLASALQHLREFLDAGNLVPPSWDVRIVEVGHDAPIDARGRLRVGYADLNTVSDYSARFEQLLSSGLPWLNVSCYGLAGDVMIVAIEMPRPSQAVAASTSAATWSRPTLLNYSGPITAVVNAGWNADEALSMER